MSTQQESNNTTAQLSQAPKTVKEMIAWLQRMNRPPLPECPIQAATYGKEPKAPHFIDGRIPRSVSWKTWQTTMPPQDSLDTWFRDRRMGIGTLGGWNDKHWLCWIDFDLKTFASKEECENTINLWVNKYPQLRETPAFTTPSGGYRYLVAFNSEPENFKSNSGFSLIQFQPEDSSEDNKQQHCGEMLCREGGHTLLPPTKGINGVCYQWFQFQDYPVIVDKPEDIGLYPIIEKKPQAQPNVPVSINNSPVQGSSSNTSVSDFLKDVVYPRLTLQQAFNWNGHNFKECDGGAKLQGNCPWHDSSSGSAFYCNFVNGIPMYRCPVDGGGTVVDYRYKLRGGIGKPRGKDFIEIAKELASDAGVLSSFPAPSKNRQYQARSSSSNEPKTKTSESNQSEEYKYNHEDSCFILNNEIEYQRPLSEPIPATETPPKGVPTTATRTTYFYSNKQWRVRYAWEEENRQGYGEEVLFYHKLTDGKVKEGKGKYDWEAYNLETSLAHKTDSSFIFVLVENEEQVEDLKQFGLHSFTFPGEKWNKEVVYKELSTLKHFAEIEDESVKPIIAYLHSSDSDTKKIDLINFWCEQNGFDYAPVDVSENFDKQSIKQIASKLVLEEFLAELANKVIQIAEELSRVTEFRTFCQVGFEALYSDNPWMSADGKLYWHTGTYYKESPDSVERKRIADYCDNYSVKKDKKIFYPYASPEYTDKLLKWAKDKTLIDSNLINPPGFNCTNGVVTLKWENGKPIFELEEHSPKHYFIYEPQVEYNPNANPEPCEKLLRCLDEPQRTSFLRLLSASIDIDEVRKRWGRQVKAAVPVGTGTNGKDSVREVVSIIFGDIGITSISLADFVNYDEGRKFSVAGLKFSRINWPSENPQTSRLDKIQSLKNAITGNKLHSEHKGKDPVDFSCKAIHLFNLNETPNLQGAMKAITDRFACFDFNKTFTDNPDQNNPNELKVDPRFAYDKEFVRNEVAPGFLNKLIESFKVLIEEGIDYKCTEETFKAAQKVNCHLWQFIEDSGLDYSSQGYLTAKDVWEKLEPWYIRNGTLLIDENKKRIWIDQAKPSDKNVKGMNQIIPRFMQLFPDAKIIQVYDPIGKHTTQAIGGIQFKTKKTSSENVSSSTTRPSYDPVTTQYPTQEPRNTNTSEPPDPVLDNIEGNSEKKNNFSENNDAKTSIDIQGIGSGGSEPLQNKEKLPRNWVVTGSGDSETGSGSVDEVPLPQDVEYNVTCLQDAIREMSWEMIQELTQLWTEVMKKAVWSVLSVEDKNAIKSLDPNSRAENKFNPDLYKGKECLIVAGEYLGQQAIIQDYIEEDNLFFGQLLGTGENKEKYVNLEFSEMLTIGDKVVVEEPGSYNNGCIGEIARFDPFDHNYIVVTYEKGGSSTPKVSSLKKIET